MSTQIVGSGKQQRARWIPEGSEAFTDPNGNGIVYISNGARVSAIAYAGNAGKSSWHYSFSSREQAEKKANEFFANLQSHKEFVQKRRAEMNRPHDLKEGEIVYNSWGWEQTNVDWYRVTKATDHFVWLQEIAGDIFEYTQAMAGHTRPAFDENGRTIDVKGKTPTKHKATMYSNSVSIGFKHGGGGRWDGQKKYVSWYA